MIGLRGREATWRTAASLLSDADRSECRSPPGPYRFVDRQGCLDRVELQPGRA